MMKVQNPQVFSMKWLMRGWVLALVPLVGIVAGCPKPTILGVPNSIPQLAGQHDGYWIYVPSNYTPDHAWPLVITLHGANGLDFPAVQIRDWQPLAEKHGFIVVAPKMRSVIVGPPMLRDLWIKDMATDEKSILSVMDEVTAKYHIDPKTVLLTGLSAGCYPLYYTGPRHPERFGMIVAMSCGFFSETVDKIALTPEARKMPVVVYWGGADLLIQPYCKNAVQYFTTHGFTDIQQAEIPGMGHKHSPEVAYKYWDAKLLHPRAKP
jgi:phospholipase/carboxylesterase